MLGEAMRHIDGEGGRFVTVLPRTRSEDKWFRDWLQTNQPKWTEAIRLPGERIGDLPRVWSVFPSPLPSGRGVRDPARIEAIFCCQFLALLVGALIERQIRTAMRDAQTADIPLYPELRACEAPSAERIFTVFADLTRHELCRDGQLVQTFEAELTPLQQQILDLLGVPATAYAAN